MKICYTEVLNSRNMAQADIVDTNDTDGCWLITRIIVPAAWRGKGVGGRILASILADADAGGHTLGLEINAYGSMTHGQLRRWYERNGFKRTKDDPAFYIRKPQGTHL